MLVHSVVLTIICINRSIFPNRTVTSIFCDCYILEGVTNSEPLSLTGDLHDPENVTTLLIIYYNFPKFNRFLNQYSDHGKLLTKQSTIVHCIVMFALFK